MTTNPASRVISSSQFGGSAKSAGIAYQTSPGVTTSAQMTGLNGNMGSYGNPTPTGAGSGGYGTGFLNLPGGGDGSFL